MLVISRKPGERVHIGEDIQIAILEITGSRVVIGIAAPREIGIRRVGAIPYEPAESGSSPVPVVTDVVTPQPGLQIEYRYADSPEPAPSLRPAPCVRIKRSRLAVVQSAGDTVGAVS